MILRKLSLAFCFLALVGLGMPSTPAKASDTLGIIGTALGGSALGLGLWNRYSIWRGQRAGFGGGYGYGAPQFYGGYGGGMPMMAGGYGGYVGGCGNCYVPQQVTCYRPVVNYVPVTYTVQTPVGCSAPVGCSGPVGCSPVGCSSAYGLFR